MTRAAITGLGVVAPNGVGVDAYWDAARRGACAIGPITRFDASPYATRLAGEVKDLDERSFIERRVLVQTDRFTWFALAAATMALRDAGVDPAAVDPYRMSVVTASTMGGVEFGQREIENLWKRGPMHVGAYQSIAWFYAATTGQLSIAHGMKGPCGVIAAEQAGGLDALGETRRLLDRGAASLVLAGSCEAPLSPYALVCRMQSGCLSSRVDPHTAYRPFDPDASGSVPGEGGAMLVVEDLERPRRRGKEPYAEILSHASTHDGARKGSQGLRRAIELSLAKARLQARDVDVVFADAAGVPEDDANEAEAIRAVFGAAKATVVTAPKTAIGRLASGGAALDVATAALSIKDQCVPPTVHVRRSSGAAALPLVLGEARPMRVERAIVLARGRGGFNSALILGKVRDDR